MESFVSVGSSRTYNFLHLSIQELLAAWHISRMPTDQQSDIVHCMLEDERFRSVFQFYAGFTRFHAPWSKDIIRKMVVDYEKQPWKNVSLQYCILHSICAVITLHTYCRNGWCIYWWRAFMKCRIHHSTSLLQRRCSNLTFAIMVNWARLPVTQSDIFYHCSHLPMFSYQYLLLTKDVFYLRKVFRKVGANIRSQRVVLALILRFISGIMTVCKPSCSYCLCVVCVKQSW